jgi:dipeptidyl aminopeptidase/acylaminoacyl peptidase
MAGFDANRIGPYAQTAPLSIWQGDSDITVLLEDTTELVRALENGGVTVEYHIVLGGEHLTTAFGFGAQNQKATQESIAWVKDLLNK